jgi:hypothetical protein
MVGDGTELGGGEIWLCSITFMFVLFMFVKLSWERLVVEEREGEKGRWEGTPCFGYGLMAMSKYLFSCDRSRQVFYGKICF